MILRNNSATEQTFNDGPTIKTVPPAGLVAVSNEIGFEMLTAAPQIWASEQPLIPPAPS
ncbi:MAG: hypothetical protein Q8N23_31680 [Archangium sp.]|nr:hypothetical protein [Archangium sp.]MDP3571114.1 hypothetical protein [Archangium sp.]